jgi:hypothetical protein
MELLAAYVTPAQHTILAAQTDVLAIPVPLDSNVSGAALSRVQSVLESMNIPGSWVTTSFTYRQVIGTVGKVIAIAQRYNGLFGTQKLFESGITLDTQWNQLSQAQKNRLQAVADDLRLDTSGITNQMTLGQILKAIADQLPSFGMEGEIF